MIPRLSTPYLSYYTDYTIPGPIKIVLLLKEKFFYLHGSVHRESNLIIDQQDVTYSVYYISVGSSTCFGC